MKKHLLFGILMLFLVRLSSGQTAGDHRVAELSRKKFQWMIDRQVDSLKVVLEDRLKYIHSNGWVESKSDVLEDLKSGKILYQNIVVEEMEVREYPATAVVIGKGMFTGTNAGTTFNIHLIYTEVYIKSGLTWLLASRHASKLP